MKDSYIMHCDYSSHFELLTDEELGRLIRDVNNYVKNGVLPQYFEKDRVLNMAFSFMKTNIDIETEKYIKKCEKNKENGRRGGRPRNPEKANGFDEKPEEAKKADTDTNIKGVCEKNAHAKEIICHLGSVFKDESCFRCMKKYKCKLPASPAFKLDHDESFEEWNDRKDALYEQWCNDRRSRGESTDIELFDYDWLNDR